MIKPLKTKTIKVDLTKKDVKDSFSEILSEIANLKIAAEHILISLPSISIEFREKSK